MKNLFLVAITLGALTAFGQQADTTQINRNNAVRVSNRLTLKAETQHMDKAIELGIFGEFSISSYAILSLKTPSNEELNALIGTLVKINETAITGTSIEPITFSIYEVERLMRDDYIYRVFGRELRAQDPDIPSSFKVHKTDNSLCYGIIETGDGRVAIPYKGVLLILTRN